MIVQLIITALIPVFLLLAFLYLTDRYDKEPVKLLFKLFLYGFLSALPVILLENLFMRFNIFTGIVAVIFETFFIAGFIEESFKRKIVLKVAYNHVAFDEKLDGIIYCAFASLGFAAIENILYLIFQSATTTNLGVIRGLLSVPAHMLFAITMGYYLSMAKFTDNEKDKKKYLSKSIIYPVIIHGLFNFILMTNMSFLFIFLPYVIFLWVYNMKKLTRFYKLSKERHINEQ
ncbi:MAG: PrsW family intramembrane metalloprotease [Clostridia bacterium]|nr:PrsW family intramembrane metalloprotease [Clostridia bacterium]